MKVWLVIRFGDGRMGEGSYLFGIYTKREDAERRRRKMAKDWTETGLLAVDVDADVEEVL